MFEEMEKYLRDRVNSIKESQSDEYLSNCSCHNFSKSTSEGAVEWRSSRSVQRLQLVELTSLFIDVSGLTREKSCRFGYAIYPDFCYTVNRHSKSVVIDLVK